MGQKEDKKINYFVYGLVISILILILSFLIFIRNDKSAFHFNETINFEKFASYGTFAGALTGVVIGLFTLYLVFETFKSQKKELEATTLALKETENTNKIQQFESAFFHMLNNHSRVIRSFDNIRSGIKNPYIEDWDYNEKTGVDLLNYLFVNVRSRFQERQKAILFSRFENVQQITYEPNFDIAFQIELVKFITKDIKTILEYITKQEEDKIDKKLYIEILLNTLYESEKFFFSSYNHLNNSTYFNSLPDFSNHYQTYFLYGEEIDLLKRRNFFKIQFERHVINQPYERRIYMRVLRGENALDLVITFLETNPDVNLLSAKYLYEPNSKSDVLEIIKVPSPIDSSYKLNLSKCIHEIVLDNPNFLGNYYEKRNFLMSENMNEFKVEFSFTKANQVFQVSLTLKVMIPSNEDDEMSILII